MKQKVVIEFIASISYKNINKLFRLIEEEIDNGMEDFFLLISSHGGDTYIGIRAYNQLKLFSQRVKITTFNLGFVESATINLYCAGESRLAYSHSQFLIHQAIFNYEKSSFLEIKLEEELKKLKSLNQTSMDILMENTNLNYEDTNDIYYKGEILKPGYAREIELIDDTTNDLVNVIGTNYKIYIIENK